MRSLVRVQSSRLSMAESSFCDGSAFFFCPCGSLVTACGHRQGVPVSVKICSRSARLAQVSGRQSVMARASPGCDVGRIGWPNGPHRGALRVVLPGVAALPAGRCSRCKHSLPAATNHGGCTAPLLKSFPTLSIFVCLAAAMAHFLVPLCRFQYGDNYQRHC